jgi:hypothetical protein
MFSHGLGRRYPFAARRTNGRYLRTPDVSNRRQLDIAYCDRRHSRLGIQNVGIHVVDILVTVAC